MQQNLNVLRSLADYFSYVSTCSVYAGDPPVWGVTEDSPVVEGDPSADKTDYASDKRDGEVLAPGPKEQPIQFVDARDLAEWMVKCASSGYKIRC